MSIMTFPLVHEGDLGLSRLKRITEGCRHDMHEPDENGIEVRIVGDDLDNAFGCAIREEAIINGFQEYVVVLERVVDGNIEIHRFNLANLIALARRAG